MISALDSRGRLLMGAVELVGYWRGSVHALVRTPSARVGRRPQRGSINRARLRAIMSRV